MSAVESSDCKDPSGHWLHICQLQAQDRFEEMATLTEAPMFTCLNCAAVARYAKNLCNPSPLAKE